MMQGRTPTGSVLPCERARRAVVGGSMQEVSSTWTAIAERLRTLRDAARTAPANGRMSAGPLRTGLNVREVVVRAAGFWLVHRVALVLFTYFAVTYANGHAHGPVCR